MEKSCKTCEFLKTRFVEAPCNSCVGFSVGNGTNWQPRNPRRKDLQAQLANLQQRYDALHRCYAQHEEPDGHGGMRVDFGKVLVEYEQEVERLTAERAEKGQATNPGHVAHWTREAWEAAAKLMPDTSNIKIEQPDIELLAANKRIQELEDAWVQDEGIRVDGSLRPSLADTLKRLGVANNEIESMQRELATKQAIIDEQQSELNEAKRAAEFERVRISRIERDALLTKEKLQKYIRIGEPIPPENTLNILVAKQAEINDLYKQLSARDMDIAEQRREIEEHRRHVAKVMKREAGARMIIAGHQVDMTAKQAVIDEQNKELAEIKLRDQANRNMLDELNSALAAAEARRDRLQMAFLDKIKKEQKITPDMLTIGAKVLVTGELVVITEDEFGTQYHLDFENRYASMATILNFYFDDIIGVVE